LYANVIDEYSSGSGSFRPASSPSASEALQPFDEEDNSTGPSTRAYFFALLFLDEILSSVCAGCVQQLSIDVSLISKQLLFFILHRCFASCASES
jgi:hypothetical protein